MDIKVADNMHTSLGGWLGDVQHQAAPAPGCTLDSLVVHCVESSARVGVRVRAHAHQSLDLDHPAWESQYQVSNTVLSSCHYMQGEGRTVQGKVRHPSLRTCPAPPMLAPSATQNQCPCLMKYHCAKKI